MPEALPPDAETRARHDMLLAQHLDFYDGLRTRERRPRTAAQRRFQEVAWGLVEAMTDHEIAYVHHLRRSGVGAFAPPRARPPIDEVMAGHAIGARPVAAEVGRTWDAAWREHRDGREVW